MSAMRKKKPVTAEQACLKMASLCSHSEQCEYDILKKLIKMGLTSAQQKEVMGYLKEEKYVDDARYAGSFARDKARFSYWGPLKIRASLIQHRIPSSLISGALATVEEETWEEGVMKCAAMKGRTLDLTGENGRDNRMKLYRHLLSRGYRSNMAVKAVREIHVRQKSEEE